MAPNLHESASFASLDLSQHFELNSKYQPLVAPRLGRDEATRAVSCDTIVANLIDTAHFNEFNMDMGMGMGMDMDAANEIAEEEFHQCNDYWYMPAQLDASKSDYFSESHVSEMLLKDANRRNAKTQFEPPTLDAAVADYWDWSIAEKARAQKHLELRQKLQQLLSIQSISSQEVVSCKHAHATATASVVHAASTHCEEAQCSSDDYFYTPSQNEEKAQTNYDLLAKEEAQEMECYWD